MIDPHRLRIWRAVVASGSVQAAARHLGYTPSTVSQHIQVLQRETGLTLSERVGRGVRPTPAGVTLAAEGEHVLRSLQRLEAVVGDLREGRSEELAIRCAASVAQEWVPVLARRLHHELPALVLEVSINEPHEAPGRRPPDLVVRSEPVGARARTGAPGEDLVRHSLGVEDFVVVLPGDDPLACGSDGQVRLADLAGSPWIDNVVYDSPTLRILLEACAAAGFAPRWAARCDDHRAAVGLVAAGLGVTAFPALAAGELPSGVIALPLVDPVPQRRLVAWQRSATAHTEASRVALEVLRELAA